MINGIEVFFGHVVDVNDPRKLGRVKVRVIGDHDESVLPDDLEWATPMQPTTSAGAGQVGSSPTGLAMNSRVMGFYMNAEMKTMPIIMGTVAAIPGNDESKHDVSKLARGENPIKKKTTGPEPKSAYAAKYPHNEVIQAPGGHVIEMDSTPGKERLHIYHPSGSYVEINNDGRMVIKSADDQYNIVDGDATSYSSKDTKLESKKGMTLKVGTKCTIEALGECKVKSSTKISLSAPLVDLQA